MQTLLTVKTDRPVENCPISSQSIVFFQANQIPKNQVAKYTGTKPYANLQNSIAPQRFEQQSLEQHLLKSGLLNVDQLVVANDYRKSTGRNLSQVLDTLGWVRQEIVDDLANRLCLVSSLA